MRFDGVLKDFGLCKTNVRPYYNEGRNIKMDQLEINRLFGPILQRHLWRKPNPRINMAAKCMRLNSLSSQGLCIRSAGRAQHVIGRDRLSLNNKVGRQIGAMERSKTFNKR